MVFKHCSAAFNIDFKADYLEASVQDTSFLVAELDFVLCAPLKSSTPLIFRLRSNIYRRHFTSKLRSPPLTLWSNLTTIYNINWPLSLTLHHDRPRLACHGHWPRSDRGALGHRCPAAPDHALIQVGSWKMGTILKFDPL